MACGSKLIYKGDTGRNGVAIVQSKNIRETLVKVSRRSERVVSVTLNEGNTNLIVISTYAPQVGCEEIKKEQFWNELDQELNSVPLEDRVILGGDLNEYVGVDWEGVER